MKIAHFIAMVTRTAGGVFGAASGLTVSLKDSGADVMVFGGADEHLAEDASAWGNVKVQSFPAHGGYGFNPSVMAAIQKYKPDLLHIHGIWGAGSLYGRVASIVGIPTVVSPHGMLDPWILARRSHLKAVHGALFERPLMRSGHIHVLSEAERQATVAYLPETEARTFTIPNGTIEAAPVAGRREQSVLYLGRLHPKKQTLGLAKSWADDDRLQHLPLVIAGWGDQGYETGIRSAIGTAKNVSFVGSLYGEAKADAFSRARFFVLPSLSEGLPMAVLEALQYGCIPVITEQCNLPELFDDQIAIRISADFSDLHATFANLSRLGDQKLETMSLNARIYSKRYLWSSVAQRMIERYDRILAVNPS
ncbi:glycosyltransferase [Devosia sp.]|uniref:glycosyltransferase n=1 Tax=Devosia sp. TaxID=1871048 RepID=UPI003BA8FF93